MGANDPFLHKNLTEDQINQLEDAMRSQVIDGVPLDPRDIFRNPERFNSYPLQVRQKVFEKVLPSTGQARSYIDMATNQEVPQIKPASSQSKPQAGVDSLRNLILKRIETAPSEEKPKDLRSEVLSRIESIGEQEKTAQAEEQRVLQTAVPTLEQVRAKPERQVRPVSEYVAGAPGAALSIATQAVLSPVAMFKQALEDQQARKEKRGPRDVAGEFMQKYAYTPGTEAGKEIVETIGKGAEALKVPPALTPELAVLSASKPLPSPTQPAPGAAKPRYTMKELELQKRIISGQDVVPEMPGLVSAGAAARKDPVAVQAAIDMLPPELQAKASQVPLKNVNLNALESHAQALSLPKPINLTKGQATGDVVILSNELNRRGELPAIAQRLNEQNKGLIENLQLIREKAAPDVYGTKPSDFGQSVIDGFLAIDSDRNKNITKLYGDLRDAAGGSFPIDAQRFVSNADQKLASQLKSEFVPSTIERQLQSFRDGAPMTFEQFEALRTNLASEIRKADRAGDGNAKFALGVVRDALEALPLTGEAAKLKPLADAARSAAKERFDALKRNPAYKAAVEGTVAPENFVETFVLNKAKGTEANVRQMIADLGKGSQSQQAVAAGIMDYLSKKSIDGQGNFSQAAFNKALRDLDPKLLDIFDPDSAKSLKNLGEVSRKVMAQPKGGYANNSGTLVGALAEKAGKAVELGLNISTANLLPLGTIAKQARERKLAQKFEKSTLEPLAGTQEKRSLTDVLKGK